MTLFDGRNFDGESLELTGDALNLGRGINDRTSSVIITGQANAAQINDSGFTEIDQSNANVAVNFSELW
ncbi:hypothetical protein [Streptomyces sp. XY332]|uniref:hypothetical protein n=1 Tax=Streptomyces sp. XY332 TaxID=1415561 RepID=UPI0006B1876F|nr:hypothetical protein [Streptomyces sp. XY332]KOY50383.1 hypothetical protein ADK59_37245 [Streptomyces sp. XY332]